MGCGRDLWQWPRNVQWPPLGWLVAVLFLFVVGGWYPSGPPAAEAQRLAWQADGHPYRRRIELGAAARPAIVVAEFYTHGAVTTSDPPLAVHARGRNRRVPHRLLQVGPGDFCRIALQPIEGARYYAIYYGGEGGGGEEVPAWHATAGLLLETRRYRRCNLRAADSVRKAFEASAAIGGDYVPTVFHRGNPFAATPAPLLSRYQGQIDIPKGGKYIFFTSSQDCSFLLIDGKQVVAAPGRHRPSSRGRFQGEVTLTAGLHQFEYLHAAVGNEACMVAAWQPTGVRRPVPIPGKRFGFDSVDHLSAGWLEHRTDRFLPDFQVTSRGAVGLADSDQWLVRVEFNSTTAATLAAGGRFAWDFGDGQTAEGLATTHIYLHPGLYQVSLTQRRSGRRRTTTNKVLIKLPTTVPSSDKGPDALADYVPSLLKVDPTRLDSDGVVQLVRALLEAGQSARAAAAGQVALTTADGTRDDPFFWTLVQLIGPLLRDTMDDPEAAMAAWGQAAERIRRKTWRAECAIEAADNALSDLLRPNEATPLLQQAAHWIGSATGPAAGKLYRVWGDWYARDGEAAKAQAAYAEAAMRLGGTRGTVRQNAWRGARSRTTEALLRSGALDQARDALRRWQLEFPADKGQGYLSLLLARYWVARKGLPQAIAVASDLLAVRPSSSYADQLLLLSARAQQKLGQTDRAAATYQTLLTDYPGSPLVETAKTELGKLTAGSD
jgi:TolA-binding protein